MKKSKSAISKAGSYEEISQFWDNHDLARYWDKTKAAEVEVEILSEEVEKMAEPEVPPVALLLQRGRSWQEEGKLFQAIAMYFRLMEYHSGTGEAQRARAQLLDLAQRLEAEGKVHQATHLYLRLAALE